MRGFNFEKDLFHQKQAVHNTVSIFKDIDIIQPTVTDSKYINPEFDFLKSVHYARNILNIQNENQCKGDIKKNKSILDIMMETGTGKTYTYTKTIFELNKNYSIFKFVIIVPTLSIKAGTINFLRSDSARKHFKEQYGKRINLHIVESQKRSKRKKTFIPPAVSSFVNAGSYEKQAIQVMIINAGMINSDTMQKSFDKGLLDKYTISFDAIASVKPFVIIDEPHKFSQDKKTWENIQRMKPQFTLRYGATFTQYENLIYKLTAVDSFNRNLVKGVIAHITEFETDKNAIAKLVSSNGTEASFELTENNTKKTIKVMKKDSLEKVHLQMTDLFVENLNKSTVLLSNGLEMKIGDKINPYSYAEKLQEIMIKKAIDNHFKIEKELLTRDVKIKPLTLFFIDNINEYRNANGYIKATVEELVKAKVELLLKTEQDSFYKAYLNKTLQDLSKIHGGYFSKDNLGKDEDIEKEINEILHDKQAILDLDNPRRFIFSKWTLREGWDNPNVFQICKLRSSGSEISKLQEVGRGLRLPVNQYGNRVKGEQFFLHYFVDFTEDNFVNSLVNEINEKSGAISNEYTPKELSNEMIKKICELYDRKKNDLLKELENKNIIDRSNEFKEGGFEYIKKNYPLIFDGVGSNNIRKATDDRKKIKIRTEKYAELKELWERLNEKVILEYKIKNEQEFKNLFECFLITSGDVFIQEGFRNKQFKIEIEKERAFVNEATSISNNEVLKNSTMKYSDFLKELGKALNVNIKTLHQSFIDLKIPINQYLNISTIRIIKQKFNNYLMYNAINNFGIEYQKVTNSIHPTKITDSKGNIKNEITASDVGVFFSDEPVAGNYFLNELFYDSELEKENIKQKIDEVVVFTKVPKNSIKIPVAGGKSYSPDFAYVLNFNDGEKKLYFIVETKNADEESLRNEEGQKIKYAEKFFEDTIKIKFETQFSNKKMIDLINKSFNLNQ